MKERDRLNNDVKNAQDRLTEAEQEFETKLAEVQATLKAERKITEVCVSVAHTTVLMFLINCVFS